MGDNSGRALQIFCRQHQYVSNSVCETRKREKKTATTVSLEAPFCLCVRVLYTVSKCVCVAERQLHPVAVKTLCPLNFLWHPCQQMSNRETDILASNYLDSPSDNTMVYPDHQSKADWTTKFPDPAVYSVAIHNNKTSM